MRKRRRYARSSAPMTESAIYDGATLLGSVIGRSGALKASTADGRSLGSYEDAPAAMLAVVQAARVAGAKP
jgi:hypothetical protein